MRSLLIAFVVLALAAGAFGEESNKPPARGTARSTHQIVTPSRLPHIVWPITSQYHRLYPDRVSVLDPLFKCRLGICWDTAITYSGRKLEAINPATGRTIWSCPVLCPARPLLLGTDAKRYIFATPHRIFALTRSAGQQAWQVGVEAPQDPGTDPESIPSWASHFMTDRRLYSISHRGDLTCIDLQNGNLRWRREGDAPAGSHLVADRRCVGYAAWHGRYGTIAIRDTDTGELIYTARLENDQPVQALLLGEAGLLLAVLSKAIIAVDPATSETRWQISTRDHFVLSTLQTAADGLFVSGDGRRITKYNARDGLIVWKTPSISTDRRGGLSSEVSRGTLYVAAAGALMAFDADDGRLLWRAKNPPGLKLQSPRFTDDAVITVAPKKPRPQNQRADLGAGAQQPDEKRDHRLQIRRFDRATGIEQPVTDGAALLTEPLESFGGLFLRDHCLIVLDGNRLIGYAEAESR